MSPWIPITVSVTLTSVAIAERFYSRFVSDIEIQKRHLKRVAKWVVASMAVIFLGIQVGCVIYLMRISGPPTKSWILGIAVSVGSIASYLAALTDYRIIRIQEKSSWIDGRIIDFQKQLIEEIRLLKDRALSHRDAITFLASHSFENSPEASEQLKKMLIEAPNESKQS
jgi:hypothetical protein